MTSAVQSVKEARDERSARLQEICAQEESSLQFSEVHRLLYDCTTEVTVTVKMHIKNYKSSQQGLRFRIKPVSVE